MALLIALYLAGLSFFFTGVEGISDNLRRLSGQRFRRLLSRATHHPLLASMLGVVLGAITQSTSVVAFLLAGMASTGLLSMGRALLVLACSNLGTALLVFIAALDLRLPVLLLIGLCGLAIAFRVWARWRPAFAVLLSLGLVFFGLDMAKQAFRPLTSSAGFAEVGKLFDLWPDAAFFLGVAMRSVVHSSAAAAAVTMTLNKGGMLHEFSSMMAIAGLGIGTALATWFLSSNLRGISRQIALFQCAGNIAACVLLTCLLLAEHLSGRPLLIALTHHLSQTPDGRMAFMYFFLNVLIVLASIAAAPWAPAWLERFCPPTADQSLSRPMYIQTDALAAPETALDLAALEQLRLVAALEQYLQAARGVMLDLPALHVAAHELSDEIGNFLKQLVQLNLPHSLAARVISFQRKQETLRALEENVFLFAQTMQEGAARASLGERLTEALDTLILTARDALSSGDALDGDLLLKMTDDRGSMMERLRREATASTDADAAVISALHYSTTLFERDVWLLRQLALWLREDRALASA